MGIDSHFFPWRPRDEGRGEAIAGSGHSLRLPTLSRYLTTAYTFLEETTLQLATLLLALSSGHTLRPTFRQRSQRTLYCKTTADYITGLGRLAKQQNIPSFLLESSTISAAAKKRQNEVVKDVGPVYVTFLFQCACSCE